MTKELTPLVAWKKAKFDIDYRRRNECDYYYPKKEREEYCEIITKELKSSEVFKNKCKFELEERNTILHKKVFKVYYLIINGVLTLDLTEEEYELLKEALV